MRKILFVCTGNMIRSPMAEYFLQKSLADRGVDDILAESTGVFAGNNNPPITKAVLEMAKYGIDMKNHRSRGITKDMVDEAELVVVMEHAHLVETLEVAPDAREKIHLMSSFLQGKNIIDIDDPIGGDDKDFARACLLIEEAVEALADRLVKYSGAGPASDKL